MFNRNYIALCLNLISFALLIPGIYLPMITININGAISAASTKMNLDILQKTASIFETIKDLWSYDKYLVAFLIALFSIGIPILKSILILVAHFTKQLERQKKLLNFIRIIGKWSMADVFVVAIFLAYLSTRNIPQESLHDISFLGLFLNIKVLTSMTSALGTGFYCFLGYCLSSLLAVQIYQHKSHTKLS